MYMMVQGTNSIHIFFLNLPTYLYFSTRMELPYTAHQKCPAIYRSSKVSIWPVWAAIVNELPPSLR